METQYYCKNLKRLQAVRMHPTLNAIEYLEVLDQMAPEECLRQRILIVHCVKPVSGITETNVRIDGGVRSAVRVLKASIASDMKDSLKDLPPKERQMILDNDAPERVLIVETGAIGDFSYYRLKLVQSAASDDPPEGFDPFLSEIEFSFKVECPSDFDCLPQLLCPPQIFPEPHIDYLAKDYASFRRILLDRLSTIMPDWKERNTADIGVALVEILSYVGDHLSYYQDAVATEAYLGTARKRISMRRHARLVDYPMHEGCNARVWVQIQSGSGDICLQKGMQILTKLTHDTARIAPNSAEYDKAVAQKPEIFETMHEGSICPAHNEMTFYTWADEECCLPAGATRATLLDDPSGRLRLRTGDVLIFEEVRNSESGLRCEKNPNYRHAVRLTRVFPEAELILDGSSGTQIQLKKEGTDPQSKTDPLTGQLIVEIEWAQEDALPFCLCLKNVVDPDTPDEGKKPVSVARGNIILAEHGETLQADTKQFADDHVPNEGRYWPSLTVPAISHSVPYNDAKARMKPASEALIQDPRKALARVTISDSEGAQWNVRRDLLDSNEYDHDFVVEMEDEGTARLRFGDGVLGERPKAGSQLEVTYRTGNGRAGNVGAESIFHIITDDDGILGVRNPMSAQGGINPESLEEVRLSAPQAFRTQQRAVTAADYAAAAEKHPDVQKAMATLRWTGSWHTMFITVDRKEGRRVDEAFEKELCAFIEQFRLAAHDVEIEPPIFVPLDIIITVCVKPHYFRDKVCKALLDAFSSVDLPDGRRGFFHPDNFTFGQPVYLSRIISTAMKIPGVSWVAFNGNANRFQRWGQLPGKELEEGMIAMDRLEIARLDNDPSAPENGKIEFIMEGGI